MGIRTEKNQNENKDYYLSQAQSVVKFNAGRPSTYFEEEYKHLGHSLSQKGTIYEDALKLELEGAYVFQENGNVQFEDILIHIEQEIKLRTKITALEIFKIGKLLYEARKICREHRKNFRGWIKDTFDFSYETALNFMRVYKNCLGMMSIAINIPISILYKISADSFPEELRNYLFEEGHIESMNGMDLTNLVKKYKEEGFDAIKGPIDSWNRDYLIYRQSQFVLDKCRILICNIKSTSDGIIKKYAYDKKAQKSTEEKQRRCPEVDEAVHGLLVALEDALSLIERAVGRVEAIIRDSRNDIEEALIE